VSAAPITVYARRSIKGARRRVLAMQETYADGKPGSVGISYLPPGGVDVYFSTGDGTTHVFLPPDVVERIKRGPMDRQPPAQRVPPLDKDPNHV
jgi:hypothetical protein